MQARFLRKAVTTVFLPQNPPTSPPQPSPPPARRKVGGRERRRRVRPARVRRSANSGSDAEMRAMCRKLLNGLKVTIEATKEGFEVQRGVVARQKDTVDLHVPCINFWLKRKCMN